MTTTFKWWERVISCVEAQQWDLNVVNLAINGCIIVVRLVTVVAKQPSSEALVKITNCPTLQLITNNVTSPSSTAAGLSVYLHKSQILHVHWCSTQDITWSFRHNSGGILTTKFFENINQITQQSVHTVNNHGKQNDRKTKTTKMQKWLTMSTEYLGIQPNVE